MLRYNLITNEVSSFYMRAKWWSHGNSHPDPLRARESLYCLSYGPNLLQTAMV